TFKKSKTQSSFKMINRIIIDGDACPVTDDIIRITDSTSISVLIIRSVNHFSLADYPENVYTIYVDHGVDSDDFNIVKLTTSEDIVDHHKGYEYTANNMEQLLTQRHISAQIRQQGGRTKGPKKLTQEDHKVFSDFLIDLINSDNADT